MRDYLLVTDLAARAGNGDEQAWDALVERYSPLIWPICRRHRLADADARAVGQSIWRQLVRQLDKVQDPGALAGRLAAAAGRECGNVRSATRDCRLPGQSPAPGVNPAIRLGRPSRSGLPRNVT
jgi:DNA-directed RNA polymerase specialized sigma24 family protein